jgi:hypothetical protein
LLGPKPDKKELEENQEEVIIADLQRSPSAIFREIHGDMVVQGPGPDFAEEVLPTLSDYDWNHGQSFSDLLASSQSADLELFVSSATKDVEIDGADGRESSKVINPASSEKDKDGSREGSRIPLHAMYDSTRSRGKKKRSTKSKKKKPRGCKDKKENGPKTPPTNGCSRSRTHKVM